MERREFLKNSTLATGAILAGSISGCENNNTDVLPPISRQKDCLAIAMWDFSWILRHHRYGEFDNWDRVLEGLAERGYNSIRMDAMPHMVAADTDGKIRQEFRCVKKDWKISLWGNDYTTTIRPREALLEFLPLCRKHNIRIGLATWFLPHNSGRSDIFLEDGGLYRAWFETLTFLEQHDLLHDVLYVDLLNEYPFWHGYDWLKKELDERSDIKTFKLNNPEAHIQDGEKKEGEKFNALQKDFYNDFASNLIKKLKGNFPGIDFYISLDSGMKLKDIDLTEFAALDYHLWFNHHGSIPGLSEISSRDQSLDLASIYKGLQGHWNENKDSLVQWMDNRLTTISETAAKYDIPCGNTEGWGPISWYDHPELDWNWVKESADICIDLALKHDNYKFLCTSNFTHPQFKGMWEDIEWHRKITDHIKH